MKLLILGLVLLFFVMVPQADALRNDSIETVWFWDKESIDVTLANSIHNTDERVEKVKKAVSSQEFFMIEDNLMHKDKVGIFSPYYLGWQGALDNSNATLKNLNFQQSARGGDVIISLTTQSSPQGYAGYTKPLFVGDNIAKIHITIYNVDQMSLAQLYSITMHEMGHAIGIGHTTADEDVMNPVANVPYPYVSPCIMQALQVIDQGKTELRCEK